MYALGWEKCWTGGMQMWENIDWETKGFEDKVTSTAR